jgi:hypothetical protein
MKGVGWRREQKRSAEAEIFLKRDINAVGFYGSRNQGPRARERELREQSHK